MRQSSRHLEEWRMLFTDYRRPLEIFNSSFRAAIGLYFFKESFGITLLDNLVLEVVAGERNVAV